MEEEKDHRQYGALEEVTMRLRSFERAEPRWMEVLKPLLAIVNFGEYAAMKSCGMLIGAVDNPELRQGYLAQMLDEVRHTNQEAYLIRYLARHAPDPAGFDRALFARGRNPICRAGRAAFETFLNDDPITCALSLQVVAETAYTNTIFVAVTEIAAVNGDPATPSVFLSVQSDEARHMANGYATLAAILADPDNLPLVNADLAAKFWQHHVFLDGFLGAVYDYFQRERLLSYREYWNRWIGEDWVGSYLERLAPFGLEVPGEVETARLNIAWWGHTVAMVSAALWPLHFWRTDEQLDPDFEYLEEKYPGWDSIYGDFWRAYRQVSDPAEGCLALTLLDRLPALCRVCHMPDAYPRLDAPAGRVVRDGEGRRHAFCSPTCETLYVDAPWRYSSRTWWEVHDGMGLDEYVERAGLLRLDGRTLVGQPHLRTDSASLWTIDDIRRAEIEIRDPLRDLDGESLPLVGSP
jgi:hypothetical protein